MKNKGLILTIIALTSLLAMACQKATDSSTNRSSYSPLIDDEIIKKAGECDYDFDPTTTIIKEQETYDYSNADLVNLPAEEVRNNHHIIYAFDGWNDSGYQDGFECYGNMWLWDDGLFYALIGEKTVKGYWYNSSIENGFDKETDLDIAYCLVLVSNQENYELNIAEPYTGHCYSYSLPMRSDYAWGIRNITMKGYYYYPEVAISLLNYLNENYKKDFSYKVGDCFSISNYKVVRILKNLNYIPVFNPSDIAWNIPSEMLDSNNNFIKSGNFEITANYKVLSLSFTLKVS